MKTMIYGMGLALVLSGLVYAGDVKKTVPPVVEGLEEEGMDAEETEMGEMGEMGMTADEMDEEADMLITEGQALKKRAAEMRIKELAEKGKSAVPPMPGGKPGMPSMPPMPGMQHMPPMPGMPGGK